MPLGKRLRKIREQKGIGLRQLAARVGISPSYLSNVERGKFALPAEDKLRAIARELDQDADQWLTLAGKIPVDPKCGTGQFFGAALRILRELRGIALGELAAKVGISAPYLCNIELGKFPPPSEEKLCSIAHELGQHPDEMLARAGKIRSDLPMIIEKHPREYAALLRSLRGLEGSDFRVLVNGLTRQFQPDGVIANADRTDRKAGEQKSHPPLPIDWKLLSETFSEPSMPTSTAGD